MPMTVNQIKMKLSENSRQINDVFAKIKQLEKEASKLNPIKDRNYAINIAKQDKLHAQLKQLEKERRDLQAELSKL